MPGPLSQSDAGSSEENAHLAIHNIIKDEVNMAFEKMLDDLNLSEEKKEPLRLQSVIRKKEMLAMHVKGAAQHHSRFHTPREFVKYLANSNLKVDKVYVCMESLRIALNYNPLTWVSDFVNQQGLNEVLSILNVCSRRGERWDRVQYECIRCIKAISNNKFGLMKLFEHRIALSFLARSLVPSLPTVMVETVKILTSISLVPPDGHERVLEAITCSAQLKGNPRFHPIIEPLANMDNDVLILACIQLINSIINRPDNLDIRIHLRNEVMCAGLADVLEKLARKDCVDLQLQLKLFDDHSLKDLKEFTQKFDSMPLDLDNLKKCFDTLCNFVAKTPCEPLLLSIFQQMLFVRDDPNKVSYFKLIEECVTQIVRHNPPFSATKRIQIDVETLLKALTETAKQNERREEEIRMAKEHCEFKLTQAVNRIKELENLISTGKSSMPSASTLVLGMKDAAVPPLLLPISVSGSNMQPIASSTLRRNRFEPGDDRPNYPSQPAPVHLHSSPLSESFMESHVGSVQQTRSSSSRPVAVTRTNTPQGSYELFSSVGSPPNSSTMHNLLSSGPFLDDSSVDEAIIATKLNVESDRGFSISFDDDSTGPKRPKPILGAKRLQLHTKKSSAPSEIVATKNSLPLLAPQPLINGTGSYVNRDGDSYDSGFGHNSQDELKLVTMATAPLCSSQSALGNDLLDEDNSLPTPHLLIVDDIINHDTETLAKMERIKEKILMQSMQRKQQQEELRQRKDLEAQQLKEEKLLKEEEKQRKKEEGKARRAVIFEQYKLKKAQEEAENEGRVFEVPYHMGERKSTVPKMRSRSSTYNTSTTSTPRSKTMHIDTGGTDFWVGDNCIEVGAGCSCTMSSGTSNRGSSKNLSESRAASARGSNTSLNRRVSNSSHGDSATAGRVDAPSPLRRMSSPLVTPISTRPFRRLISPSGPGSASKWRGYDDGPSDTGSNQDNIYPRLYKQPESHLNRAIIINAVEYCLFAGAVNIEAKQRVLEEITRSENKNFLILFRDSGCRFRALYSYNPESEEIIYLYGTGPKVVDDSMFDKFFKYNSGGKCFSQVHTKHLSVTIDAFTIHSGLWQGKRTSLPNKKDVPLII